jgi:ubiquinol-cytochrome c reductase cytochrome c subunit
MCHNFAGAGGALTRGKYAPALNGVAPKHIYEAMDTGPQSMPVFNDTNLDPQAKQEVISYIKALENQPDVGGMSLGNLGPVSEGLFIWVFGLGIMIGCAVWLGKKAA